MGPLGLIMQTSKFILVDDASGRKAVANTEKGASTLSGASQEAVPVADTLWRVSQMSAEGVGIARSQSLRQKDRA